jgi:hypothetical protein
MKKILRLSAATALLFMIGNELSAQASATATATATIVSPISISKTIDLDFGNVAVTASGGTVVLAPDGSRTPTGGVNLPAIIGTVASASFDVSGEGYYTYAISLPASVTLTRQSGTETMVVDNFTSIPSGIGTFNAGADVLYVGATLNVSGGQTPGVYVSATPFTVSVNYN